MKRIPENDLMDVPEQARAYDETDFSEAHDAFVSHFRTCFPDFKRGNVLDLGCGTADITVRFAKALPDVIITGVDGASAMLEIGMQNVARAYLADRITLIKVFLPDRSISPERYDAVISNSLLHHLAEPEVLWDAVVQSSNIGIPVFVMDLMRPESVEQARQLVDQYAGDASPVLQKDFFNSLLAAYRPDEVQGQLRNAGLAHLATEIISDRHFIVWGYCNA